MAPVSSFLTNYPVASSKLSQEMDENVDSVVNRSARNIALSQRIESGRQTLNSIQKLKEDLFQRLEEDCFAVTVILDDATSTCKEDDDDMKEIMAISKELECAEIQIAKYAEIFEDLKSLEGHNLTVDRPNQSGNGPTEAFAVEVTSDPIFSPIAHPDESHASKSKAGDGQSIKSESSVTCSDGRRSSDSGLASEPSHEDDSPTDQSPVIQPPTFPITPNGAIQFQVRQVVSPSEFYIQPTTFSLNQTIRLRRAMQTHYNDPSRRISLLDDFERSPSSKLGKYAVCFAGESSSFHRCQIVDWREENRGENREFNAFLVDVGRTEWIPVAMVWKIDQKFCDLPASMVRCKLYDTQPRNEGPMSTLAHVWSMLAIDRFKALALVGKPMAGYLMNTTEPYNLIICDSSGSPANCINVILVNEKLAKSLTDWNRCISIAGRNSTVMRGVSHQSGVV